MEDNSFKLIDLKIKPKSVKVRTFCDISINFSLNKDLPHNSSLIFRIRGGRNNKNDWYFLQPYDPNKKGYTKLRFSKNFKVLPVLFTGKDLAIKYLVCEKEGITRGSAFKFTIRRTLVQSFTEQDKKIEILVEEPNQEPKLIKPCPTIKIYHDDFSRLTLICPSTVSTNQIFDLLIRIEDKFFNTVEDFEETISLFQISNGENRKFIKKLTFKESNNGIAKVNGFKFSEKGVYQIQASYKDGKFISNPVLCSKKDLNRKLYWGYIHGHSNLSDGILDPNAYFNNLVNAGLNFGTISEHDHIWETSNSDFDKVRKIVKKFHKDGTFVSFFGYEWGYWYTGGFGDICVYHYDDSVPILRSDTNKYNSTKKLLKKLLSYEDKVLLIGHHSALRPGFRNWDNFNNRLEKLVEIYSAWGNQEYSFQNGNPLPPRYKFFGFGTLSKNLGPILEKKNGFVQTALERGYKLGFTAGGDDHIGNYPSGAMTLDNGIYPSGIMAAWAKKLDKTSIWNALSQRHCYGTTGPRVIIEFNLGDFIMGDIIDLKNNSILSNERKLYSTMISPIKIVKLDLIRNNQVVKSISINTNHYKFKYTDHQKFNGISFQHSQNIKERFVFYYLRIFLSNNHMAWSSPIWIIKNE